MYTKQLCEAMAFMHEKGAIHRDLKPKNILLASTDPLAPVRICDFGLATWLPMGEYIKDGVLKGTAEFLSFEMASGKPYGHPTDVWAVGVICFMFLCGRLPFDDPDRKENIDDNLENPNYSPLFNIIAKGVWEFREEDNSLSPNARDFITKMLDLNRDERPSFAAALEHPFLKPDGASHSPLKHVSAGAVSTQPWP